MTKKELRKMIRKEVRSILNDVLVEKLVKVIVREAISSRNPSAAGMEPGISPDVTHSGTSSKFQKMLNRDDEGVPDGNDKLEKMTFMEKQAYLANLPRDRAEMEAKLLEDGMSDDDDDVDRLLQEDMSSARI